MITKLRVKNFKALRDVEIDLTPIHVLIGPNDSGKTSILDTLAALCRSVDHKLNQAFLGSWKNAELVWGSNPKLLVTLEADFDDPMTKSYSISVSFESFNRDKEVAALNEFHHDGTVEKQLEGQRQTDRTAVCSGFFLSGDLANRCKHIKELLHGVHYYRFDPSFLALPVAPDTKRSFRMEYNGFGLALCLDEILSFDRDRFNQLEDRFKQIFPHIKSMKLMQEEAYQAPVDNPSKVTMLNKADGKGLYFQMQEGGQLIPASQASDGTLLVLAYLAVLYLPEPPRLLLIEEPENGIHPRRLRDILTILRDLVHEQSHTQVVLTTHSPYAVDLFEPEEVTLCTKSDTGEIKTTRLSDSPEVMKQLDVFTLGEIWTAEGDEKIAESKNQPQGTGE